MGLAIFLGIVCVICFVVYFCLKSVARNQELKRDSAIDQTVRPLQTVAPITLSETFSVKGVKTDNLMELTSYNKEIEEDYETIKDLYEIGERVYEQELFTDNGITVEGDGKKVLRINDKEIGYLNEKDSGNLHRILSTYRFKGYSVEAYAGRYMKVIKNPDYDKEEDDEYDKKWVEWDELERPKVKLIVRFQKGGAS